MALSYTSLVVTATLPSLAEYLVLGGQLRADQYALVSAANVATIYAWGSMGGGFLGHNFGTIVPFTTTLATTYYVTGGRLAPSLQSATIAAVFYLAWWNFQTMSSRWGMPKK